jgi:hypothetical protein
MAYVRKTPHTSDDERRLLEELRRVPPNAWCEIQDVWQEVYSFPRSVRWRIFALAVAICSRQGVPTPQDFADALCDEFVKEKSRNADNPKLRDAAKIVAATPSISDGALAKEVGVTKPTVAAWRKKPSFVAMLAEWRDAGVRRHPKDIGIGPLPRKHKLQHRKD